jgi:capsular exopolysaccharide synthesis family protein
VQEPDLAPEARDSGHGGDDAIRPVVACSPGSGAPWYGDPVPAEDPSASLRESIDLRAYLDVLVRRWRVIAVVALVAVVAALILSLRMDKEYRAHADILVGQPANQAYISDSFSAYIQSFNAARSLNNEIQALESGNTRDAVAAQYDGPLDPDDVSVASVDTTSDVARVSATASDPKEVAKLVNTYVEVATQLRREQRTNDLLEARSQIQKQVTDLEAQIASIRKPLTDVEAQLASNPGNGALEQRASDLTTSLASRLNPLQTQLGVYQQQLQNLDVSAGIAETGGSRVLTAADVPTDPVAPKPVQNAILALIVGLLLGVVVAFLRDNLDERIREMADLERAAPGLPVLTGVPENRRDVSDSFVAVRDEPASAFAEAFRTLRTSLKFAGLDHPIRVLQVSSAVPGEGKTTTVANLAEAFAQGGERVAVVCCDLRRPRIQKRFGQSLGPGFTDVLLNEVPLASALRQVSERLFLLPAGSMPPNPSELLSSTRASAVVDALAAEFDLVILDCTPILPVSDAMVVSRMADTTIVVVDARTTKRRMLHQAVGRLGQASAPIAGLVLNGIGPNSGAYDYAYAYTYGYAEDAPAEPSTANGNPAFARRG